MAKDYARSTFKSSRARKRQRARRVLSLIIFVLLLSIAIPSGWTIYQRHFSIVNQANAASWVNRLKALLHRSSISADQNNKAESLAVVQQEPEIHFNFYTELPKMQVTLPAQEDEPINHAPPAILTTDTTKPTINKGPEQTQPTNMDLAPKVETAINNAITKLSTETQLANETLTDIQYVVQVGAYRSHSTASEMRVSMLLAGFDAKIVKTMVDNQEVYRIQQGPYNSLISAKNAQKKLQAKGYDGVITPAHSKERG